MYDLYIANKNYSSWSLRPWVLMRTLGIAFEEKLVPFGEGVSFSTFSPTGKVPCLVDDGVTIWQATSMREHGRGRQQAKCMRDFRPFAISTPCPLAFVSDRTSAMPGLRRI